MNQTQHQIIDEQRRQIEALEADREHAEQLIVETNAKLQETKLRLARLIESSPDAVIFTDKEGNVAFFSESAEALLGYRAKEVIGQKISMLDGDEAGTKQVAREIRKRGGDYCWL